MSNHTIGLVLFDAVEELDFVGPWEVFTMSNAVADFYGAPDRHHQVFTVSERGGQVTCAKGMRVLADHAFADCPDLSILLVPGGQGTRREVDNPAMRGFIAARAARCTWVTSVCTGSVLLTAAGPARGKRVTTHWGYVDELRARNEASAVLDGPRYVQDGAVVTASGVSAGIDMVLWLIGQLYGADHARATQRAMQYDPAPPYTAEVTGQP